MYHCHSLSLLPGVGCQLTIFHNFVEYWNIDHECWNVANISHYIISKSDILEINCSSIALLEKCISQDTEPLQGAYDKI